MVDSLAEWLERSNQPARATLNRLNLIDFFLKNGSLKFKSTIEDSVDIRPFRAYTSDDDDELMAPIRSVSSRIASFLESPEELKSAREEATRMREKFKGMSSVSISEDPRYGGFSSDDHHEKPVNLAQKLGVSEQLRTVEPTVESILKKSQTEKTSEPEPQASTPITNTTAKADDFDFLADPPAAQPLAQKIESTIETKAKKLLPAPPKKGALPPPPRKAAEAPAEAKLADDLLNFAVAQDDSVSFSTVKPTASVQKNNADFELDFLGSSGSTSKPVDDPFGFSLEPKKPAEKNSSAPAFIDLSDLKDAKNEKKESGMTVDPYVQMLAKSSGKLPPPPSAKQPAQNNYDFLNL